MIQVRPNRNADSALPKSAKRAFVRTIANIISVLILSVVAASAQTTSFTFQGKLNDNGIAANGIYEMQFGLFDAASGGTPVGATQSIPSVTTANGIFTVALDFGAASFTGQNRYIQIAIRRSNSQDPFTALSPRQPVTSTPYSVKSLYSKYAENALQADNANLATNANQLGGISANQYVQTNDSRLSDARSPTAQSSFYIQNRQSQQALAHFNISGDGTVGGNLSGSTVTASAQFNIGNNRILSAGGTDNIFIGFGSGTNNTGFSNSFYGRASGTNNSAGNFNSFFGHFAGTNNTIGSNNSFFGRNAGSLNTIGSNNTLVGSSTNVTLNNLSYATAIGAGATVNENNKIVLGRNSGADLVSVPGDLGVKGSISITDGVFVLPLDNQGSIPVCAVGFPGSSSFVLASCASSIREESGAPGNNSEFVNGLKEQQKQIDMLRRMVCEDHPTAAACIQARLK